MIDKRLWWLIIPCLTLLLLGLMFEMAWIYGDKSFEFVVKAEMDNNTLEAVKLNCQVNCCNIKGITEDNRTYYDTNRTCYNACIKSVVGV